MLVDKGKMHAKVNLALKKISNYCFYEKKNLKPVRYFCFIFLTLN
tara:strand:- start:49 stop:183 length:135 start_codon:yes stop_codon:yes gene_type:complete